MNEMNESKKTIRAAAIAEAKRAVETMDLDRQSVHAQVTTQLVFNSALHGYGFDLDELQEMIAEVMEHWDELDHPPLTRIRRHLNRLIMEVQMEMRDAHTNSMPGMAYVPPELTSRLLALEEVQAFVDAVVDDADENIYYYGISWNDVEGCGVISVINAERMHVVSGYQFQIGTSIQELLEKLQQFIQTFPPRLIRCGVTKSIANTYHVLHDSGYPIVYVTISQEVDDLIQQALQTAIDKGILRMQKEPDYFKVFTYPEYVEHRLRAMALAYWSIPAKAKKMSGSSDLTKMPEERVSLLHPQAPPPGTNRRSP